MTTVQLTLEVDERTIRRARALLTRILTRKCIRVVGMKEVPAPPGA